MPTKKQTVLQVDADTEYTQHIFATSAGNGAAQDAIESVIVHHDAYLVGINMDVRCSLAANNDYYIVEVSSSGNYQAETSDQPNTMMVQAQHYSLATQGAGAVGKNSFVPTKLFFRAGDRIYINQSATSAKTTQIFVTLYWQYFQP